MSLPRQHSTEARIRKRRKRTIITAEQLEKLEKTFKQEQWPNKLRKERLAFELGSSEQFVSIWFQNKRARVKREEELAKMQLTDKCFLISETQKNVDDFNADHEKTSSMTTLSAANDMASMSDDSISESVTTSEQFEKNGSDELAPEVVAAQAHVIDIKPTVSQEDNTGVGVTTSDQELLTSTSSTSSTFHASSPVPAVTYANKDKVVSNLLHAYGIVLYGIVLLSLSSTNFICV